MQKAVQTYDRFAGLAGVPRENHAVLTPVSHIVQRIQLEIVLSSEGSFQYALKVDEKSVIPATEKSANRVGDNNDAHPLSDQLRYVAAFGGSKYEAYIQQLSNWAASEYTHPKLHAIERYIRSGTILSDLVKEGLIALEENGVPEEKCCRMMIRWRVLGFGEPTACWEDGELFRLFDEYYRSLIQNGEQELCMISGEREVPALFHPKGIIASAYGAKLISANDSSGFTYRGRFDKPREAATIGYRATQKAHCALQWVASDQGVNIGGRVFTCWNPNGLKVPKPIGPFRSASDDDGFATPTEYQKSLFAAITGYRNELPDDEDVVIAAFDAATTGRLSVTFYSEVCASKFMDNLCKWYSTCVWSFGKLGYQSPSIRQIANCAFGTQRKQQIETDDRVLKEQTQRLLNCVVNGSRIPKDIVQALFHRVNMPLAYSGNARLQLLSTACAVIRKYHNDIAEKEEYSMTMENNHPEDRSFQYGRLLAVFEKIERDTYAREESREPNAVRLQNVFSERPLYATRILKERLTPYYKHLPPASRSYYERLIAEIMETIENIGGASEKDKRLGDTYILGYYLQKKALYTSKKTDEKTEEEQ